MGVSFRVSRTGTRYRHKPPPISPFLAQEEEETRKDAVPSHKKTDPNSSALGEIMENEKDLKIPENAISLTISLFPNGYSIGKPIENERGTQAPIDIPKLLHPYDKTSEVLFSAIECGQFPGDILNDIPFQFADGRAFCEVRDYRECPSEGGCDVVPGLVSPIINRVSLRVSLDNLIKDVPAMADSDWTYGDLMEVESRLLKAIRPQLCLTPSPQLDRLSGTQAPRKLNFKIHSMRRKRLEQSSEYSVSSDNKIQGKRACLERASESVKRGDPGLLVQPSVNRSMMLPSRNNSLGSDSSVLASSLASQQSKYHIGVGSPKVKDQWPGSLSNVSIPSPAGPDMMNPFGDNGNSINVRRDDQDGHSSPLTNKKARLTAANGPNGNVSHPGSQIDNSHGSDIHWKMQQQLQMARYHNSNSGMQNFPQQVFEGVLNQEGSSMPYTVGQHGTRYNLKEEPVEMEGLDKSESNIGESQQSRLQQRIPQPFMRSGFPQSPLNNLGQPLDYSCRKEDSFQKRKMSQSPRMSAGGLPQSPLSSKSGEFSSGSAGPQFGGVVSSGLMASQKDKSTVTSLPFGGVNPSFTSNTNDAMQRQHHAQAAVKRRSTSLPKTPGISGVGSPASVGTMTVPISASSPPVGNQALADQSLLDRFSKIEVVTARCQLNRKKNKVNEARKPSPFSSQDLARELSNLNNENLKDETCKMPLSKSLVGGNINVCKTRILNFVQTEHVMQGNGFQLVSKGRTRMIMSEKPIDGSVAIHIGEIDDADYLAAQDFLPTLANTHMADLLAAQFCSLMTRDGYHLEDQLHPNPVQMNQALASHQLNAPGVPPGGSTAEMQQFPDGVSGQLMNDIKPTLSGNVPVNSSQNLQGPRMLPPGTAQAIQVSQGLLPGASSSRLQQSEQIPQMQQAQHNSLMHQEQFQRSPMMIGSNSMQHLNIAPNPSIHMGGHVANKPSPLQQLQLLQHQQQPQQLLQSQQQQQQSHMQRKMMPGVGGVGIGNIGNNIAGLGNFANVMGLSGVRGAAGAGMSAPLGNMSQNPMNLSSATNINNALRSGALTPAALMKLRMAQAGRTNVMGSAQASIGAIPGARQMNPGPGGISMIGSPLNRNISQMQQRMGAMGPPKLIPGMNNPYMNPQLFQQQSQMQQMQQQQQQMQQLQQQQFQQPQETTSPLQSVISPQMGSPSSVGIPNQLNQSSQQASPQQMSQRTPMSPQLSAGAMHQMSGGNPDANPTSPQISSQTMGSVGSIANSPLELQGVNKSNSANNG